MHTLQKQRMLSTLLRAPPATTEGDDEAAASGNIPIKSVSPTTEWHAGGAVDRYTERMMQHCIDCYSAAELLLHRALQGRAEDEGEQEVNASATARVSEPGEAGAKVLAGAGKKMATARVKTRKVGRKSGSHHHAKSKNRKDDKKAIGVDRKFNFGYAIYDRSTTNTVRIICFIDFSLLSYLPCVHVYHLRAMFLRNDMRQVRRAAGSRG